MQKKYVWKNDAHVKTFVQYEPNGTGTLVVLESRLCTTPPTTFAGFLRFRFVVVNTGLDSCFLSSG